MLSIINLFESTWYEKDGKIYIRGIKRTPDTEIDQKMVNDYYQMTGRSPEGEGLMRLGGGLSGKVFGGLAGAGIGASIGALTGSSDLWDDTKSGYIVGALPGLLGGFYLGRKFSDNQLYTDIANRQQQLQQFKKLN